MSYREWRSMIDLSRRRLITGLPAFIAAPAIIKIAGIMPIRAFEPHSGGYYSEHLLGYWPIETEIALAWESANFTERDKMIDDYLGS